VGSGFVRRSDTFEGSVSEGKILERVRADGSRLSQSGVYCLRSDTTDGIESNCGALHQAHRHNLISGKVFYSHYLTINIGHKKGSSWLPFKAA